jgi:hypothetical protein
VVAEIVVLAAPGSGTAETLQRRRCRGARRRIHGTKPTILMPEAPAALKERIRSGPKIARWKFHGARICARPAQVGCPDCDRLFDPAAAAASLVCRLNLRGLARRGDSVESGAISSRGALGVNERAVALRGHLPRLSCSRDGCRDIGSVRVGSQGGMLSIVAALKKMEL